jgi:5-methylcytosine-specific restriction endonuclease McrA
VTQPCSECGRPVTRMRSRAQQLEHAYCRAACRSAWLGAHRRGPAHKQWTRVSILCDACGALLWRQPAKIRQHNFCGPACRTRWQQESGYTSGALSAAWRGGASHYRGPNWRQQRHLCLRRDGGACQRCGAATCVDVHHRRPSQTFTSHLEANDLCTLITLCTRCHTLADGAYRRAHPDDPRLVPACERVHVCENCGEPFIARGPRAKRCDRCWQRVCLTCGKIFRPAAWREVGHYCSRACAGTPTKRPARAVSDNP